MLQRVMVRKAYGGAEAAKRKPVPQELRQVDITSSWDCSLQAGWWATLQSQIPIITGTLWRYSPRSFQHLAFSLLCWVLWAMFMAL